MKPAAFSPLLRAGWVCCVLLSASHGAHATLFADNEARRAILDLRERHQALVENNAALRQIVQEQQQALDTLKADMARLRARDEQLSREVAELQRQHKEQQRTYMGEDDGAADPQPQGKNGHAKTSAKEKADWDAALKHFRAGNYQAAQTAFRNFLKNHGQSAQRVMAQFWLGNSEYALRNYRNAIASFRVVVQQSPQHERAPEAMLAIANCQVELRETTAARATLKQIIQKYPKTEAAQTARDRLSRLK